MLTERSNSSRGDELQEASRRWWNANPMSYDWRNTLSEPAGRSTFFTQIDQRLFSSSPFYRGPRPFSALIPFQRLPGMRVLEIGCGLGSHAQLLAETGCRLTAIDLTPTAVQRTRERLALHGLKAEVKLMDGEQMEFDNDEFDFVWSWGVIHHSADPRKILQEAHRVLRPFGEFRLMVYHRRSINALVSVARGLATGKLFRGISVNDVLSYYSDGYIARFYTASQLRKALSQAGFFDVSMQVLGQKSELLPLPGDGALGRWKAAVLPQLPDGLARLVLSRFGGFLFATALKGSERV